MKKKNGLRGASVLSKRVYRYLLGARRFIVGVLCVVLWLLIEALVISCGPAPARIPPHEINLSNLKLGDAKINEVGMFFCLDMSGSMSDRVGGQRKIDISKQAMRNVFQQIDKYMKDHPQRKLNVGLCGFTGMVRVVQPLQPFNMGKLTQALDGLSPSDGTAIGEAITNALRKLMKNGDETKAIFVMTDGENTTGAPPDRVVQAIKKNTNNVKADTAGVEVYLVSFDVNASVFRTVKSAGAKVVESRDQKSLEKVMNDLVQEVLLEAPDKN